MNNDHPEKDSKGLEIPCHLFETTTFDASAALPGERATGVPVGGVAFVETVLLETTEFDFGARPQAAADPPPANHLLTAAKAREVQRAMMAEMRGERSEAACHFLAAAHMELVLATDYEKAADADLALRSRLSAASCFWRAGQPAEGRQLLDSLIQANPDRAAEIQAVLTDLMQTYPALAG